MSELKTVFDEMKSKFVTGQVEEPVIFYLSIGDEKWMLTLEPDECHFREGKEQADGVIVLKTSKDLFIKMIRGEYNPGTMDFMSGKIKSNDPMKLKVLSDCFKRG